MAIFHFTRERLLPFLGLILCVIFIKNLIIINFPELKSAINNLIISGFMLKIFGFNSFLNSLASGDQNLPGKMVKSASVKINELLKHEEALIQKFSLVRTDSSREAIAKRLSQVRNNRADIALGISDDIVVEDPLAEGKAKKIIINRQVLGQVFAKALHPNKEKELKDEVEAAENIYNNLSETGMSGKQIKRANLALDFAPLPKDACADGVYTVMMPQAAIDLEKKINQKGFKFPEALKMIWHIANGLHNLHKAGYVHGDLKPENFLLYRKKGEHTAKLADFGKSQPLEKGQNAVYSGNPRYCALEGSLNFESEVFSAALLMIRVLESEFLAECKEDMLSVPNEKKSVNENIINQKKRRGIEKFVVLDKACPQKEITSTLDSITFYASKWANFTASKEASKAVNGYIDELIKKLRNKYADNSHYIIKINILNSLLKLMTQSDPKNRPSMENVAKGLWMPDSEDTLQDVQDILTDETLKKADETHKDFPKQLLRDFIGAYYYFDGKNLHEQAFKKLKEQKKILASAIGFGKSIRSNDKVRVQAAQILKDEFGDQALKNIGSICQQSSFTLIIQNIMLQQKKNYNFKNDKHSPPEYWIEDQGENIKMSLIVYLEGYILSIDAEDEDEISHGSNCYVIAKREILISKEDLKRDWTNDCEKEVAPSLQVQDYYSHSHANINSAIKEMMDLHLLADKDSKALDRFITAEDIEQEEIIQMAIEEDLSKQLGVAEKKDPTEDLEIEVEEKPAEAAELVEEIDIAIEEEITEHVDSVEEEKTKIAIEERPVESIKIETPPEISKAKEKAAKPTLETKKAASPGYFDWMFKNIFTLFSFVTTPAAWLHSFYQWFKKKIFG